MIDDLKPTVINSSLLRTYGFLTIPVQPLGVSPGKVLPLNSPITFYPFNLLFPLHHFF